MRSPTCNPCPAAACDHAARYAAPPTGDLRWRPPHPAATWSGVRNATSFGATCPQLGPQWTSIGGVPGTSEDCLFLNVYAPVASIPAIPSRGTASAPGLPVMVYFPAGQCTSWSRPCLFFRLVRVSARARVCVMCMRCARVCVCVCVCVCACPCPCTCTCTCTCVRVRVFVCCDTHSPLYNAPPRCPRCQGSARPFLSLQPQRCTSQHPGVPPRSPPSRARSAGKDTPSLNAAPPVWARRALQACGAAATTPKTSTPRRPPRGSKPLS